MLPARITRQRRFVFAVLVSMVALGLPALAPRPAAAAAVTAVRGSACSYYVNVGLFGGPQMLRGCGSGVATTDIGYSPEVTLPPGGSASAVTATDADGAKAQYGPAVIHGGIWPPSVAQPPVSGPQDASTQGSPEGGTVTSFADIKLKGPYPIAGCRSTSDPTCGDPGGFGPPPVWGDSLHVECSASPTAVTGSSTFRNTFLAHATNADGDPLPAATEPIPDNPPVNYTRSGVITNVGDVFTAVFNQQIVNPDGSLTINAVHMYLFGPTALGEVVRGQVNCGTTPSPLRADDTVAPTCGTPVVTPNGPTDPTPASPHSELVGVFDAGTGAPPTGLQSITNVHVINGTVNGSPPADYQYGGQTGPIPIGASRSPEAESANLPLVWSFDANDVAGNTTHCGGVVAPPQAGDDSYGTRKNSPLTVPAPGVLGNDTSPNAGPLTAGSASAPANGSVVLAADGSFTYTPNALFSGTDTFSYVVTDSQGAVDTAVVTVTVSGGNEPPVAGDDSYSTNEDAALTVPAPGVLGNDTDPNGNPLSASAASAPAHGTVSLNADGSFTYTPTADFNGTDSFSYVVGDGKGGADTGLVTITVAAVNDAPVAGRDTFSTNAGVPLSVSAPGVLGNDTDVDGGPLSAGSASTPAGGRVVLNADGSFSYVPAPLFTGTDTFSYTVSDGRGASSTGLVTIAVGAVSALNSQPVAGDDTYSASEDVPLTVAAPGVLGNDTDANANPLTAGSASAPTHGTVALAANGSFTYTPNADYNGPDSFAYVVSDGQGGSDTGTVTISVSAVNDAPVAGNDTYSTTEDIQLTVAAPGVLGNDTDVDGNPLTAGSASVPAHGTVALAGNGSFTYRPSANFSGTDTFTYTVSDGPGGTGTVTIAVSAVNDAPVAGDDTYVASEDTPLTVAAPGVLGNDTDVDANSLTAGSASVPAHGTVSLGVNGSFTYIPSANFNGTDSFTYVVSDGAGGTASGLVTITVAAVNDAPVAVDDTYATSEDTPVTVAAPGVLGNDTDIEGNPLTAVKVTNPAHGTVTLNADGSFTYTPAPNYNGADSFTYKANDGSADSTVATVTITVAPVNDAPVAVADAYATGAATRLAVAAPGVLGNDTDVDGDLLTAGSASVPANGTVTLAATGSFTYTPNNGFTGTDTFTYLASDGNGASATGTVSITVTRPTELSVNDVSVVEGDAGTSAATFTVTRTGNLSGPSTVRYKTGAGTATPGSDYTAVTTLGTVSFAAGDATKTVTVSVSGDTLPEKDETFTLILSAPTGAALADASGTATIVNDDAPAYLSVADIAVPEGNTGTTPATFTVTRSGNTSGTSTVSVKTSGGTATAGTDYAAVTLTTLTFGPGVTTQTVATTVTGDTTDENNETFTLALSGAVGATTSDTTATATIVDDDGPVNVAGPATFLTIGDVSVTEGSSGPTAASFTVNRSGNVSAAGTVKYTTGGGTATAGTDYTSIPAGTVLSFAAGQSSASVTVNITGDTFPEANETFNVTLSAPTAGTVLSDAAATATIVNDDGSAYLTVGNIEVIEGNSETRAATFTVTRTGNTTGASTVKVTTSGGTATGGGTDYATIPAGTLVSFAAGQTSKTVTVNVTGDTTVEPNETFNLVLSAATGATISDASGTATIVNDD